MQIIQVDVLLIRKQKVVRLEDLGGMIRQLSAENGEISADLPGKSAPRACKSVGRSGLRLALIDVR